MPKVSRNKYDRNPQRDVMKSKMGNVAPPCILLPFYIRWPGYGSRHRDSLRAGWSGDRIHVMVKFSVPSRPASGPMQLRMKWVPDLSWGAKRPERGADHSLPYSAGLRMGWSYTSTPHCACTAMSWGDLYLFSHIHSQTATGAVYKLHAQ